MDTVRQQDWTEVGRRLGHDLARYRVIGDAEALPVSVMEGMRAGRGPRSSPDRFERKWLQLRTNAYRRGRIVDERVNAAFLRRIDVAVCPVTRVVLTHGRRLASDWSVDRLNNDGAYAPGNLAVLSTQANGAKGDRRFDEVLLLARAVEATDGLEPVEWLRLASLMLGPSFATHASAAPVVPLVAPIAPCTVQTAEQVVQYTITRAATTVSTRNALARQLRRSGMERAVMERIDVVVALFHRRAKHIAPCWDAWLLTDLVTAFMKLRATLEGHDWARLARASVAVSAALVLPSAHIRPWRLDARGYAG